MNPLFNKRGQFSARRIKVKCYNEFIIFLKGQHRNKNLMSYSIIFLGLCILVGSWFILQSIQSNQFKTSQKEQFRYELISPNDSNIIIFDKQSGDYFSKYIEPNEGPTEWQKQKSPISTSPKLI